MGQPLSDKFASTHWLNKITKMMKMKKKKMMIMMIIIIIYIHIISPKQ
jgi:hypothetical protein